MNPKAYLPTVPQVSREIVATLAATLIAAWLISKVPAWRALVRGNSLNNS